jgi:signal peptidase I
VVSGEPTTSAETTSLGAARDGGNGAGPKEDDEHRMDDTFRTAAPIDPAAGPDGVGDGRADLTTTRVQPGPAPDAVTTDPGTGTGRGGEPGDGDAGDGGDGAGGDGDGDGDAASQPEGRTKRRRPLRSAIEWALVIGGALLVALVIRSFLLQAFWIPTASMEPTLQEGDRVLVNKLSYDLHDVNRGDIIVFERPEAASSAHPEDDIKDLIKRVVGLPGETIEARDGAVYVDGRMLEESYLPDGVTTRDFEETDVPEGFVFVMGDNRGNSSDSRSFGPVDEDLIVGRAFIRIYPLGDIGGL